MFKSTNAITYLWQKNAWPLVSIIVIIIFISLFNIPVMATLWRYSFDDGTYSHAYIIPIIVFYLYYLLHKNNELLFRTEFSWFPLIIFLLSNYVFFVATTAQISLAYWLATLLLICTSINLLFLTKLKVFFPAIYFVFLIPIWGTLTIPLQSLSVYAVKTILNFTSIPIFIENEFVHIPEGVFEIAGGCSGLRYLLTSLAISSLFVFLYLRNLKNIILFSFIAILGALITNWLRIVILIIIGHQTNMTSSLMGDHNMFGWYLYIPFMFLLFKLGNNLVKNIEEKSESSCNTLSPSTKKLTPNSKLITIFVIALLLSSTTIKSLIFTINHPKQLINDLKLPIHPTIYHSTSVDNIIFNDQTTYLIYHFNSNDLEAKPTFFDNKLIPNGWKLTKTKYNKYWQYLYIEKDDQLSVISISYEISNIKVATPNKFKMERLKHALLGEHTVKLHWKIHSCILTDCDN